MHLYRDDFAEIKEEERIKKKNIVVLASYISDCKHMTRGYPSIVFRVY